MAPRIPFDDQDKAAFAKLDEDFAIDGAGEVITINAQLEVVIERFSRADGDQFRLRFHFPGEPLNVKARRAQFLEELGVGDAKD